MELQLWGLSQPKPSGGDGTGDNFCEFWSVLKLLLLLSCGKATFEQGFVMNKNMFDANSCGSHLIARRLVKDYCTLLVWED